MRRYLSPWRFSISIRWLAILIVAVIATSSPASTQEEAPQATRFPKSLLTSQTLTNDWFGFGPAMRDHGVSLGASATYFFNGLASGQGNHTFKSGGKGEVFLTLDGGKMGLWKGFGLSAYGELNVGKTPLFAGGTLVPNNIAMTFPGANETIGDLSLYLSQRIGRKVTLMFGKFNMIVIYDAGKEFSGGRGIEMFQNLEFVAPASGIVPPTIFGGIGIVDINPVKLTLMVYDPSSAIRRTGFGRAFEKGVTCYGTAEVKFPVFGKTSKHAVSLAYSTRDGIDLRDVPYLFLPPQAQKSLSQTKNRYYISYDIEQTLWRSASNPKKALGLFGKISGSDGNPNPLGWSALIGLGGSCPFKRRPNDKLGVGFYYINLSEKLKNGLKPLNPLRNEYGTEVFYNLAVTPWFRVSFDAQFIRPVVNNRDTAIILGLRSQIVF